MESVVEEESFELLRTVVQVVPWATGVRVGARTKLCACEGNSSKSHSPWEQEYSDLGGGGMLEVEENSK